MHKGTRTYYAKSRSAWREWLEKHHEEAKPVWLIIYKKDSGKPSLTYPEAVDEAICFGWIDSTVNKRDADSYYQFFTQRKPKSNWSKVNKLKVARLKREGLLAPAGLAMIALAKRTGTWTALDEVERTAVPEDLAILLAENKPAAANWELFPRSVKKAILEWIMNAKRPETRQKRITETVTLASENKRANQYQPKS